MLKNNNQESKNIQEGFVQLSVNQDHTDILPEANTPW